MPFGLSGWFREHTYMTLAGAATLEGMGLPVPAELLFISAAVLVQRGEASPGAVIMSAVLGNVGGALVGFTLAYVGGRPLLRRAARTLRLKPDALHEVDRFFARYGAMTIFLARFVGFIRVPAVYTAGASRMAPWRFAAYSFAAALIWNTGWAVLAFRFGPRLPDMVHRALGQGALWVVLAAAVLIVGGLLLRRSRRPPVRN